MHRFLICMFLGSLVFSMSMASGAQPAERYYDGTGETWNWGYGSEEGGGGGSSYLGVDIADVSPERLAELKLKEEHGAEITMVDQDAPAGKAGLQVHDVIVSLNGTAVESTAQLRRMIKETPAGRVVNIGISRDGQPVTIKLQLADRHKSMAWEPNVHIEMPEIPKLPAMPDFDVPVSVVIVHSSLRSGLMVENITPQLGEFFGIKGGNGVLVRSVEKGSRGEKSGFRAGDVVIKVNNQPVHDTSDFTHALRSSSGGATAVTVMREKREQNLTLTLPEKKDSGSLLEDSFEIPDVTAETEQAVDRAGEEMAHLSPAIVEKVQGALRSSEQALRCVEDERKQEAEDRQKEIQERQEELQERQKELQERLRDETEERRQELQDQQKEMEEKREELQERQQELQQELRHEFSRALADI
jgi:serine protease Do